jgi:hypothetical protein
MEGITEWEWRMLQAWTDRGQQVREMKELGVVSRSLLQILRCELTLTFLATFSSSSIRRLATTYTLLRHLKHPTPSFNSPYLRCIHLLSIVILYKPSSTSSPRNSPSLLPLLTLLSSHVSLHFP